MAKRFSKPFYNSKQWQEVRSYVLKRDSYLCVKCGRPAEEVHHIIHLSPDNIGDPKVTMNPDNLASMCRDCHFAEHKADTTKARLAAKKQEYAFDENGYLVRVNPPQVANQVLT